MSFAFNSKLNKVLILSVFIAESLSAEIQQPKQNSYFQISADLLVWYPSEEVTNIWVDKIGLDVIPNDEIYAFYSPKSFDLEWSYGFRFGLGYDVGGDSFDTFLNYTWYHSHASHRVHADGDTLLNPELSIDFHDLDNEPIIAQVIKKLAAF